MRFDFKKITPTEQTFTPDSFCTLQCVKIINKGAENMPQYVHFILYIFFLGSTGVALDDSQFKTILIYLIPSLCAPL